VNDFSVKECGHLWQEFGEAFERNELVFITLAADPDDVLQTDPCFHLRTSMIVNA
jgi:hypothetical protein